MTDMPRPPEESPISHRDALAVGTQLAEFEILGLLGVGGFGMVYRAWDHSLRRRVAIKEFMPSSMAARENDISVAVRSSADSASFEAGLRSFVAEAQLLAQFDHPSLVKVFRIWEANNTAYMAMPLYSGITLKQAQELMRQPPPEAWLRKLLWPLAEALKVLHAGNTMHRDVSPDNVFLQNIGPPVLLDLGAARRAIQDYTHKHTAILKVNYAPIEQYGDTRDMRQGPWTDLYALAAVVYGCVADRAPPPATYRVLEDRMTPFAIVANEVQSRLGLVYSPAFSAAIDQALVVRPDERTQSIQAFAQAMDLQPAKGLDDFDWRVELGHPLLPTQDAKAVPAIDLDLTYSESFGHETSAGVTRSIPNQFANSSQTVAMASPSAAMPSDWETSTLGAPPASDEAGDAEHPSKEVSRTRLVLLMVGMLTLSLLGFFLIPAGSAPYSTQPVTGVEVIQPGATPASAAATAGPAAVPPHKDAASPNSSSANKPVLSASPPPNPSIQTLAPKKQPPAPLGPAANPARQSPAAASTDAPSATSVEKAGPDHAKATETPAAAKSASASASTELCGDKNVFSRPWCLHEECQKPENSRLSACVELKQRQFDNANKLNPR